MPQNCPKAGDLAVWCAAAGWCAPGRWQAQRMLLVRRAVHRAGMQVTWAVMRCCWTPCSSITFSACADPTLPYFTLTYPSPAPSERGVSQSKRAGHLGAWRAAAGWCAPGPAAWWRARARAPCGRPPRAPRPPPPAGPLRTSSSARPARAPACQARRVPGLHMVRIGLRRMRSLGLRQACSGSLPGKLPCS